VWRRRLLFSRRVALVRRTRYTAELGRDEWSFPKGHPRGHETLEEAALREVEEETGWRCAALAEAGSLAYDTTREGRKEVRFWNMRALCHVGRASPDESEVVELAWVTPRKALCMLTYPDQARLLSSQLERSRWGSWSGRRLSMLGSKRRQDRLAASIQVLDAELEQRRGEEEDASTRTHLDLARKLLEDAKNLLRSGDLNGGWHAFYGARYHETFALDDVELWIRARELVRESENKLKGSWRGNVISDLLASVADVGASSDQSDSAESTPATPKPPDPRSVAEAQRLADDRAGNVYRRLDHTRDQLTVVGLVALPAFVALVTLLATGTVTIGSAEPDETGVILGVVLFGILGGSFSAGLSVLKAPVERAIPEVLSSALTTVFRTLAGAITALAAYAFLQAGLISVEDPSAAYAVAFAAGFSERFVAKAAETIGK
jgi:8-oxo-dGTP pyrophosphatase MutT (NUDIX family)